MRKILILLLLPITLLSQNSWINFEVRFDYYSPQESNFFMVGNSNGDTVMYYQPTISYEVLDTTIYLNSGDYLISLIDNYGDGWNGAYLHIGNDSLGFLSDVDWIDSLGTWPQTHTDTLLDALCIGLGLGTGTGCIMIGLVGKQ